MTTYVDPAAGFHAFALQARTDTSGDPVDDVDGKDLRALVTAIFTEGVVIPADGFAVNPSTGLTLAVGSGDAFSDHAVLVGADPGQGAYLVRLGDDATAVTLAAADLSNPRIDQLFLVVLDDEFDSTGYVIPRLAVRKGTPGVSPTALGPDASWKAYVLLASIRVPAGATEIVAGDITDERPFAGFTLAGGGSVPTGTLLDFAGGACPSGFLLANGAAVSRVTYSRLFAVIGTTWGAGNGSTTFNVPDIRGRLKIGWGGGTGLSVGELEGAWDHTHTTPQHDHGNGDLAVPAHSQHNHPMPHTHTFADSFTTGTASAFNTWTPGGASEVAPRAHSHSGSVSGTTSEPSNGSTGAGGPTTHGAITGRTSNTNPGPTGAANPPVAAVLAIIKT